MTQSCLWLTDSRNRLTSKRREVRTFPSTEDGYANAWRIVIDAEVEPDDTETYLPLYTATRPTAGARVMFNDYWSCYGWDLSLMDADAEDNPPRDILIIPSDTPAPLSYDED
jgi:hypothetical protein